MDIFGSVKSTKTCATQDIMGNTVTRRYALVDKGTYYVIILVAVNGVEAKNKFGGYATLRTGQEAYVRQKWKEMG